MDSVRPTEDIGANVDGHSVGHQSLAEGATQQQRDCARSLNAHGGENKEQSKQASQS